MTVTADQLRIYIGATVADLADVEADLADAVIMVDDKLTDAYREVPDEIRDRAVKEVGRELYKRRDSESGSSQFADYSSGQPVAGPRDPFARVWPIIRPYVLGF